MFKKNSNLFKFIKETYHINTLYRVSGTILLRLENNNTLKIIKNAFNTFFFVVYFVYLNYHAKNDSSHI